MESPNISNARREPWNKGKLVGHLIPRKMSDQGVTRTRRKRAGCRGDGSSLRSAKFLKNQAGRVSEYMSGMIRHGSEGRGHWFESSRAHQSNKIKRLRALELATVPVCSWQGDSLSESPRCKIQKCACL